MGSRMRPQQPGRQPTASFHGRDQFDTAGCLFRNSQMSVLNVAWTRMRRVPSPKRHLELACGLRSAEVGTGVLRQRRDTHRIGGRVVEFADTSSN